MKLGTRIFLAIGTAGLLGAGAYAALLPNTQERFIRACEHALKERLRSPATYIRISATNIEVFTPTLDQFMGWSDDAERQRYMELVTRDTNIRQSYQFQQDNFNKFHPLMIRTYLEYDASNSYGTPLRAKVACTDTAYTASGIDASNFTNVRVDGDSALEWSIDNLLNGD